MAAAVFVCAAIIYATSSPTATGGNTQMLLEKYLPITLAQAEILNFIIRKFIHLSAFGILAFFIYNSFAKKHFLMAWIMTTLFAATDEIHQFFVPDRTGSVWDVALDSLGAFIALALLKWHKGKSMKR